VDTAHHIAHLTPLNLSSQQVDTSLLTIEPSPSWREDQEDAFKNVRTFFSLQSRHESLTIRATSQVETFIGDQGPSPEHTPTWESVQQSFIYTKNKAWFDSSQFLFDSPQVFFHEDYLAFSAPCFQPQTPILSALMSLMTLIHTEMTYESESTTVHTTALEALTRKKGVCQDFAHLMLSCLRARGLAARYVSGYLLTEPPPGQPRLIGSDASHAWVSVFLPECAAADGRPTGQGRWVALDPTNNRWGYDSPGEDYVQLAAGRDFTDVSPVRGVIHGGANHQLRVAVTVTPSLS
jgi:transglutaminase-like putative cysteine protease